MKFSEYKTYLVGWCYKRNVKYWHNDDLIKKQIPGFTVSLKKLRSVFVLWESNPHLQRWNKNTLFDVTGLIVYIKFQNHNQKNI